MNATPKRLKLTVASLVTMFALATMIGCQGISSLHTTATTTTSQQTATGNLSVSPSSLTFAAVQPGASQSQTETLTNNGLSSVTVTQTPVTGAGFSMSGLSLPLTLAAGQSAKFNVSFSPTSAGSASGTIAILSNASNPNLTVPLAGSATPLQGQLTVTPATLGLGSVTVGTSALMAGTLSATGGDVTIMSASSNNSRFDLSGISLPMTIQAGHSAAFNVTFSPQTTGAASATLTFVSNGVPSSITDALTGTGTTAPAHTVNLSWNQSSSSNIVGYNIYRSTFGTACEAYARLNASVNDSTSYADSSVIDGQSYCYVTTAVNSSNEESAYSAVVRATIPAP